jgi:hypothetical protein
MQGHSLLLTLSLSQLVAAAESSLLSMLSLSWLVVAAESSQFSCSSRLLLWAELWSLQPELQVWAEG